MYSISAIVSSVVFERRLHEGQALSANLGRLDAACGPPVDHGYLALTLSVRVGHELSPRGIAFLRQAQHPLE